MVLEIQEEGIGRGIDGPFKSPEELPHGLLVVPEIVRDALEKEWERLRPLVVDPAFIRRTRDDWTIDFYFRGYGHEVLYRSTEEGPEVLAVGLMARLAFQQSQGLTSEQLREHLRVWAW